MDLPRYIFALILGTVGVIIIFANWSAVIMYMKNKEKLFSLVPIAGGAFLCIAFAIIPDNPYVYLCWIALFIDIGCLPMVIRALIRILSHSMLRSHHFRSEDKEKDSNAAK